MLLNLSQRTSSTASQLFKSALHRWNLLQKANYGKDGHYDVIIVGGGVAGTSLAASIAKSPILNEKRVLLLDAAPKFKGYDEQIYSNRVYAMNKNSASLLEKIGAWDTIKSIRYRPVKQMQVWDYRSDALITFNHEGFQGDLAYIIENDVLLYAILKTFEQSSNIEIRNSSKIEKVLLEYHTGSCNEVHLSSGEIFSSELLVGADGANSIVRKEMDTNNISFSYDQMGLIATVKLDNCTDNFVAWQRFLPDGVLALLPLSDELSSIVWSTDTKHFHHLMKLDEGDFIDAVNNAFIRKYEKDPLLETVNRFTGGFLQPVSQVVRQLPPQINGIYHNSRAGFPLGFSHSSSYVNQGVVLIGDAAHRIHPLAGLGLNLGMGDVKCLTEKLEKGVYNGALLGNMDYLRQYEQEQLRKNVPIMFGVHSIQNIYKSDLSIAVLARSIAVQLTQQMSPLKNFFINKAMG